MNKKEKALEFMKTLDIYKPYIRGFKDRNQVCYFERYGGYWVDQNPEVYKKMKEIEKRYKCQVYAITHEYAEFGECFSFLLITNYPEEWEDLLISNGNRHCAYAYVWNKDYEDYSEFGSITIQSFGGGITRVA